MNRYSIEVQRQIVAFVQDCKDKNRDEVIGLYNKYEAIWHGFANRMNQQNKKSDKFMIIGFTDAFESSLSASYKTLSDYKNTISKEDYDLMNFVFNIFRRRNLIQRLIYWLEIKFTYQYQPKIKTNLSIVK